MTTPAETLVHQYYDTFVAQDLSGFMELLTDDVIHEINQGETEKGKDLFKKFMENYFTYGKENVKNLIVIASADGKYAATRFVASGKYTKACEGCPPPSGQAWELPITSFFEIRNNKIAKVSVHYNIKDWMKQVA